MAAYPFRPRAGLARGPCSPRGPMLAMISMAQLIVRNVENEVVRALKQRAARHGVSAEAEHRAILKGALLGQAASRSFKQALLAMPDVGTDRDFDSARDSDRHVDIGSFKAEPKPKRDLRAKRSRG